MIVAFSGRGIQTIAFDPHFRFEIFRFAILVFVVSSPILDPLLSCIALIYDYIKIDGMEILETEDSDF